MNHDEINNPAHYQLFPDVEAIDVIKAALTPAEFIGYLKGSALKYRLRAGDKGPAAKCIGKAHWYQNYLWNVMEYLKPDRADLGDFGQQNMIEAIDCDSRTITEWPADDSCIDIIGTNGNDGLHYQSNDGA